MTKGSDSAFTRRIVPRGHDDVENPCAVERLVRVAEEAGYALTPRDAQTIWRDHSNLVCAGWLFLPDSDEDVLLALLSAGTVESSE